MNSPQTAEPLRIGILGAARITELALVSPARATGHRLVAVAARDPRRAREFADRHGLVKVHGSYDELIADREVDVIYNPLPNALHAPWNQRAARAGKHVLSEKPSAANAEDAAATAAIVDKAGVVFMEAFHYPYHPLFHRVEELLAQGAIGNLEHIDVSLTMPAPPDSDPRWSADLAGGSTMDLGCYAISCVRLLSDFAGGAPRIVGARAEERAGRPGVDERLYVDYEFPSGATATAGSDMAKADGAFSLTIRGSGGEISLPMFAIPGSDDSLILRRDGEPETVEHLGRRSSYTYQLEALANAIRGGEPVLTDQHWAVEQASAIDHAYRAAGMQPRRSLTSV